MLVKVLFLIGVIIASVVSFLGGTDVRPWIAGIAGIALIVALSAIREQPFNPGWLTNAVFFIRVFVAHDTLAARALKVFAPGGKAR